MYRIKTKISEQGSTIEAGTTVPKQDRRTREQRLEELDEDFDYQATQLDRDVTSKAQIRLVLETFRDRLFTEIFPGRTVVPKTLIFAKDDNHAEEIVTTARQVFGEGNDFAAKITYNAKDPKALLQKFRNSPTLRIVATVDLIATGTDVIPIECVFFMRDVKSRTYFEQMKGRGARTINDTDFQTTTPDANAKERFVIVDAVGVTEHPFVDAAPLNRNKSLSLKQLMERAATLTITADETATLASRLSRLERELTTKEQEELRELAGMPLSAINQELMTITDPDVIHQLEENAPRNTDGTPNVKQAIRDHIDNAITPLAGNPTLRQRLLEIRSAKDRVIDEVSVDELLSAGGVIDYDKCRDVVSSWKQYLEDNKDEITLIQVLYSQPANAKVTFKELSELADRISAPPRSWTIDLIWNAYQALDPDKRHQNRPTPPPTSSPYSATPSKPNANSSHTPSPSKTATPTGSPNKPKQRHLHRQPTLVARPPDTIIQTTHLNIEDLDLAPFTERGGIDGAARDLGNNAQTIIDDLNRTLATDRSGSPPSTADLPTTWAQSELGEIVASVRGSSKDHSSRVTSCGVSHHWRRRS